MWKLNRGERLEGLNQTGMNDLIITAEEVSAIVRDMKLPSFQLYPGDWQRDSVSGCSLAARQVWFESLLVMHDARPYGHLVENESPIRTEALARRVRCSGAELRRAYKELTDAGVPRLTGDDDYRNLLAATLERKVSGGGKELWTVDMSPLGTALDGVTYSRRMVKDQRIRVIRQLAGRLGGNPKLVNQRSEYARARAGAISFSSSSSSSVSDSPEEENHFPSRSGGGGSNGSDRRDRSGWEPVWTQRAFQYRVDKIRDFVKRAKSHDKIGPGDEDFDAAFQNEFGMTWDYWTAQSDAHASHFGAMARGAA